MRYSRVHLESFGYELAPVVVTTAELEERLAPLYRALRMNPGQLEALTGIAERRWWHDDYPLSLGAAEAAKKALAETHITPNDIEIVIYAGVCREQFEPATACRVAALLGISSDALIYDISNACLGVLNGIIEVANRIELGQCRAGLVVSCETAREINEIMIEQMVRSGSMDLFRSGIATLTGGSGAVAVLVVDRELSHSKRRQLLGGAAKNATRHHGLCRWGWEPAVHGGLTPFMTTDAVSVLKYGVELGERTWQAFLTRMGWTSAQVDKVICHQVGSGHREAILKALDIPLEKDFTTYEYLGNIGTVSLPLTAALAEEREFLQAGDRVGFLGIGSGLNCLMLGVQW
jgi:3-oxoacyl-[acyl-carrier-protein] synthase-3